MGYILRRFRHLLPAVCIREAGRVPVVADHGRLRYCAAVVEGRQAGFARMSHLGVRPPLAQLGPVSDVVELVCDSGTVFAGRTAALPGAIVSPCSLKSLLAAVDRSLREGSDAGTREDAAGGRPGARSRASLLVRATDTRLQSLRGDADVELSTDEPTEAWRGFSVARSVQSPGQLGDRIYAALERVLAAGRPKALILGSDSPGLPAAHIRALLASSADASPGSVDDGGFYAAGQPRPCSKAFDGPQAPLSAMP